VFPFISFLDSAFSISPHSGSFQSSIQHSVLGIALFLTLSDLAPRSLERYTPRTMTDMLLSPPWWLYCSVIAIGLAAWVWGNKRADPRSRSIGIGIIGLGAVLAVMSHFIETDSQKVNRQSKELVLSVLDQNWDKFTAFLAPDAKLSIENSAPLLRPREQILEATKVGIKRYGIRGANGSIEETKKQDNSISTIVRVYSMGDIDPGHPLPSLWQLDWVKGPDGRWNVIEIHALEIGNTKGPDMRSLIPQVH